MSYYLIAQMAKCVYTNSATRWNSECTSGAIRDGKKKHLKSSKNWEPANAKSQVDIYVSHSRFSRLREFRTSSFFNCVVRKLTVDQIGGSVWSPFFSGKKIENELLIVRKIIATATIEKRENGLGTSPRVVELIPRRAGSISSLLGAKTNLKA